MRRLRIILFSIFCVIIVAAFGIEIFAAVYLSLNIKGDISYQSLEIGAEIFGTSALNISGVEDSSSYLSLIGDGSISDNVYTVSGQEDAYSNITANIGTTTLSGGNDEIEFLVFIKNVGDRYIIPSVLVSCSDDTNIDIVTSAYYFDLSEGHVDPISVKEDSLSSSAFISSIKSEVGSGNYSPFSSNSSIDNGDTYALRVQVSLSDAALGNGSANVSASYEITIGFMADVQYTSNNILSVYQEQNQTDPAWVKFGYNATLDANATKVNENNMQNLELYLRQADEYGNANILRGEDDYFTAPVYSDIDIVNIDVDTGEIIGKLSDTDYNFEWYGRDITLPAGTTLASGRTLEESETFTVDVYTYYPDMYIRRWVVGNRQWISISDSSFAGAVYIEHYYTATFEATIFNSDKTVSHNSYGIYPRSYVYDRTPLTSGSTNYLQTNYGYGTYSGSTNSPNQSQMMTWTTNLTRAWADANLGEGVESVNLAQGENYTAFIYNLLYIVKYANNDSQAVVGKGNIDSRDKYYATGVTVTSSTGTSITTGGNDGNSRYESEFGGGTIGLYNSSSKGTATYDSTNNYKMSDTGYNNAGFNYGYNSTYTFGSDKMGLYTNQFLTYNTGGKRVLTDGYIGSNSYTSVFCLGQCNPWGNVNTWTFGMAVISDGTNIYSFINFDNYDYQNSASSWYMSTNTNGFESNKTLLTNRGYVQLTYNLPVASDQFYRYLGTSMVTDNTKQMLVGLPSSDSSTASSSTGLADKVYISKSTANVFGCLRGGNTVNSSYAGAFYFSCNNNLTGTATNVGLRVNLV